jgi:hypothetical protein
MISPPPNQEAVQQGEAVNVKWQKFFSALFNAVSATQQSGTTAQRPTSGLFVGRFYFDTTLGIPIWYEGPTWVNATGAPV